MWKYVHVEFCYKLHICRAVVLVSSRVVSSMMVVLQVIELQVNMNLYTIVLLGHDG